MRLPAAAIALLVALLALAPPTTARTKPKLKRFADCTSIIKYGNRHVGRYQPGGQPGAARPVAPPNAGAEGDSGGSTGAPVAAAPAPTRDDAFSETNTQEAGVDEPDIVKTDGKTVWAIYNGVLRAIDVRSGGAKVVGEMSFGGGYGHQLLRSGDRLLVTWYEYGDQPTATPAQTTQPSPAPDLIAPTYYAPRTVMALVSVADAKPKLLSTLTVDGDLAAARRTGSTARIVLRTIPRAYADGTPGKARHVNAWLPAGTFKKANRSGRRRALVRCRATRRPRSFSGLEALTVLTIDLDKGLQPIDSDAIMSGGETVYASQDELFVATQRYDPETESRTSGEPPSGTTTQIHRFAVKDPALTRYRGSGSVPGYLLSQFAMSERNGVLRVASTDTPPWFSDGGRGGSSQSYVTTLQGDGSLERIGQVGGLGKGERIFAVRFIDDIAYVVTFRQVDPLYTVDVSDPAKPRVRGELKILGYSAYLHPAGDGRLIGVGQDADESGSTQGTQISLFDVSDVDDPKLLQKATVGDGSSSSVEWDHHAFLYWAPKKLAVLPVSIYGYSTQPAPEPGRPDSSSAPADYFFGAIGFTVGDSGIGEKGRIDHGDYTVERSLVVGDRLFTLSSAGLKASDIDTFADLAFVSFQ